MCINIIDWKQVINSSNVNKLTGWCLMLTISCLVEAMQNINNTMGVMDLGGGSTQVTFVPREKVII